MRFPLETTGMMNIRRFGAVALVASSATILSWSTIGCDATRTEIVDGSAGAGSLGGGGGGASGGTGPAGAGGTVTASCVDVGAPMTIFSAGDSMTEGARAVGIVPTGETTQVIIAYGRTGTNATEVVVRTLTADPANPVGALSAPTQTTFPNGSFFDAVSTGSTVKTWYFGGVNTFDPLAPGGIDELTFSIGAGGQVAATPPVTTPVPLPPSCPEEIWGVKAATDTRGGTHLAISCTHAVLGTIMLWVSDPVVNGRWISVGDPQAGNDAPKLIVDYQYLDGVHMVFGGSLEFPLTTAFYVGSDEAALRTALPFHLTNDRSVPSLIDLAPLPGGRMFATGFLYRSDGASVAAIYTGVYTPADHGLLTRIPAAGLARAVDLPDDGSVGYFLETKVGNDGTAITLSTDEAFVTAELWHWSADGALLARRAVAPIPTATGALGDGYFFVWTEQDADARWTVRGQRIVCR
jgi:hypothetical protein